MENYSWLLDNVQESIGDSTILSKYKIGDVVRILEGNHHARRIGTVTGIDLHGICINFPPNLILWCEESQIEPVSELKVGDIVCVKSRKWYEVNKDIYDAVEVLGVFTSGMTEYCGKSYRIKKVITGRNVFYKLEGTESWSFSREMFDLGEDNPDDYLETYD